MSRRLLYVLGWSMATVIAVGGSWVGLRSVLPAATSDRPPVLSASQLRQAASAVTSSPTPSVQPSPTGSSAPPPPASAAPSGGPPGLWEELPAGDGEDGAPRFQRTFVLRGGEVVIWASFEEVSVVSATPQAGYTDSVTRWSPNSVRVSFQSVGHTSRVWVTWRNGPYAEVTETA